MKKKILILGCTGMLGSMAYRLLSKEKTFKVSGTYQEGQKGPLQLDVVSNFKKLELICKQNKGYDYFINCIGITRDIIQEKSPASVCQAIKVNSIFPQELALFCLKNAIRVIHISTDGVFAGRVKPYVEDDPTDSIDIYGKTKSLGEARCDNFLNIRCSIVGPSPIKKRGLFEWFNSQPENAKIFGYTNCIWHGVSTVQLTQLFRAIISNDWFDRLREESHIFHFAPNASVSKLELLKYFKLVFKKKITIVPAENKIAPSQVTLATKFHGIKKIYPHGLPIEKVVSGLIKPQ